jgi:hypothetical protein
MLDIRFLLLYYRMNLDFRHLLVSDVGIYIAPGRRCSLGNTRSNWCTVSCIYLYKSICGRQEEISAGNTPVNHDITEPWGKPEIGPLECSFTI